MKVGYRIALTVVFISALALLLNGALWQRAEAQESRLKLVDVHNHLPRGLTLEHLINLMDENSISITVLMPTFYGGNKPDGQGISDEKLILDYAQRKPDRIIPFMGMQRPVLLDKKRWEQPDAQAERLLRFTESQLRTGSFKGMGEFILWHYGYRYPSGAWGEKIKIPADSPLMFRFLDLATKYNVPVNIHYEIDEESLPYLKKMLEYGRQAVIILAHNGGRADIPTLQTILNDYPNVLIDWSGMSHFGGYGLTDPPGIGKGYTWYVKNPIEIGNGHLRSAWKPFAEQYQDRIIGIGFDGAHPEQFINTEVYNRALAAFRSMLSDLSPEAARKIGYENAERLFGRTPR
jgi:hypothetical protein